MMGVQLMFGLAARSGKFVALGTVCATRSSRRCRSKRTTVNGYPEETNARTDWRRRCSSRQSYRQQYGFNAIFLLPVNLYGPRDNFDLNHTSFRR